MNIALTGATGFVGSHIAESLTQQGYNLTCLVRRTSNLRWIHHLNCRTVTGNIDQPETLKPFVENQDIVIHAAGLTSARNEHEYMQSNAISTKNLLDITKQVNPHIRRFVLVSSQAAAGPASSLSPMRENETAHPITAYGRSKQRAEEITLKYRHQLPVTIVRPPTVYGPRDQDVFIYFKLIDKNIQPIMGYENTVSVVYVKNLTHGILLAMIHPDSVGQTYFITDNGQYTWDSLSVMIAKSLGKKPIRVKIPNILIWQVALLNHLYSKITKKPVLLNKEKILEMKQRFWVISNEKAKQEFGYEPKFSTERGIKETAVWYKNHNLI